MNYLVLERCVQFIPQAPKVESIVNKYALDRLLVLLKDGVSNHTISEFSQMAVWIPSLISELEQLALQEQWRSKLVKISSVNVADYFLEKIDSRFSETQLYACLYYALLVTQQEITSTLISCLEQKNMVAEKASA